jgi:diaminopimelate epimerase
MKFYKYQGTGNDFVMIDNRGNSFPKNDISLIAHLCDRRFGVGADGLILLENDDQTDFRMVYYNSDGRESSMCGNGGRCIVAFAKKLGIIENQTTFIATDGLHFATIEGDVVSLQMKDVDEVKVNDNYVFLDTGSPHHVEFVEELKGFNVAIQGAKIRFSDLYGASGSNVNFVQQTGNNSFAIRTYERGVEDETLSCGTGATAVAIAMFELGKTTSKEVEIQVQGGELTVSFNKTNTYNSVFLKGSAQFVFEGDFKL